MKDYGEVGDEGWYWLDGMVGLRKKSKMWFGGLMNRGVLIWKFSDFFNGKRLSQT